MKITHSKDAIHVSKPEGTKVTYFLFPEYEVHYNEQIPHSTQTWHHHEKIWETLYIIEGELTAKWKIWCGVCLVDPYTCDQQKSHIKTRS